MIPNLDRYYQGMEDEAVAGVMADDLELYPYKCPECGCKLPVGSLGYDLNFNESIYCGRCDEEWGVERDEVTGGLEEVRR